MKRLIRSSVDYARRYRPVYASEEEYLDSDDAEFGDASDVYLSGDIEKDFEQIADMLRQTSYEDLGDALEDIVHDPKLYTLLAEGFGDGDLANVKMSSDVVAIPVTQLLPSQSEIGLDNSLNWPLSGKQSCKNLFQDTVTVASPIITYRKTFIIDGHHRWSQLYMMNPEAKITAINFNYSEASPYRALRNFQGAIAVANKSVPKSYSKVNNVYDMSDSAIRNYINSNMSDACLNDLIDVGVCDDKESAVDYILENIKLLQYDNPPFANAPAREYMPQTDKKSVEIARKGQTDI